jgi:hypothetical protein
MKDMLRNVAEALIEKDRSLKLYHPILNFSIQISEKGNVREEDKGDCVIGH